MTASERPAGRSYGPDFLTELFHNPLEPGYADAARRGRRTRPVTRALGLLTLIVIGFLLAVAYRQTIADEPARTKAREGLIDQVQRRRAETDQLQARADELREQVAQSRERELGRASAQRLGNLEAAAGLLRVGGDGVFVVLGDGRLTVDPVTGQRSAVGRVQDRDLQLAANALWAAGAEAISINGQRLTATSTIRLAGEAILVDRRPVTSPYEVAAIGPDDLEEQFRGSEAAQMFRQLASVVGMSYQVRTADDLSLPAAADPQLRFATPSVSPSAGADQSGAARDAGGATPTDSTSPTSEGR